MKNDLMELKNRIKNAIVKGINEAFDIEDMGYEMDSAPKVKQSVRKHSKMYDRLENMLIHRTIETASDKTVFLKLSDDDRHFISTLADTDDEEIIELIKVHSLEYFVQTSKIWNGMIELIDVMQKAERPMTADELRFYNENVKDIKTTDHTLYAFRPAKDRFDLRRLIMGGIYFIGKHVNLNWIDVSEIDDMQELFSDRSYHPEEDGDDVAWYDDYTLYEDFEVNGNEDKVEEINSYNAYIDKIENTLHLRPSNYISPFNGDISLWDVSNVTDMSGMFANSSFNGDLSEWDVSHVRYMRGMFINACFHGTGVQNWDVSNVRDMVLMFYENHSFDGDVSKWDVRNVTDMTGMFAYSDFHGDVSNWDVSNVRYFIQTFSNSSFGGNISKWKVSSASSMFRMFEEIYFEQDLSEWQIPKNCGCEEMFLHSELYDRNKMPQGLLEMYKDGLDYLFGEDYDEDASDDDDGGGFWGDEE